MKLLQQIPQEILEIFTTLQQHYEVYFVGGCVRDAYLNKEIHDYDCTTLATPSQMKQVLSQYKIIETGIKHGTLTIINKSQRVEITTFRKENSYQNHRSPSAISFSKSLKEDCKRRDFTMNALAYDGKQFFDFFGGQEDIHNQCIRCIGHPQSRFEEDALRILRAVRFSLQLNFEIEKKTKEAIFQCLPLLTHLSIERCRDELFHILKCSSSHILQTLNDYHLLSLYSLTYSKEINDRFNQMPNDIVLRLASLFTDEQEARFCLKKWKCSNHLIQQVLFILQHSSIQYSKSNIIRMLYDSKNDFELVRKVLIFNQIDSSILEEIKKNNQYLQQLAINGHDCIQLGIQGKHIKTTLEQCIDYVCEDLSRNNKERLIAYIKQSLGN